MCMEIGLLLKKDILSGMTFEMSVVAFPKEAEHLEEVDFKLPHPISPRAEDFLKYGITSQRNLTAKYKNKNL